MDVPIFRLLLVVAAVASVGGGCVSGDSYLNFEGAPAVVSAETTAESPSLEIPSSEALEEKDSSENELVTDTGASTDRWTEEITANDTGWTPVTETGCLNEGTASTAPAWSAPLVSSEALDHRRWVGCVDPGVSLTGVYQTILSDPETGAEWCVITYAFESIAVLDALTEGCPDCDVAFEVAWDPPVEDGTIYCDVFTDLVPWSGTTRWGVTWYDPGDPFDPIVWQETAFGTWAPMFHVESVDGRTGVEDAYVVDLLMDHGAWNP